MNNLALLKAAFVEGLGVESGDVVWATLEYRGIPEWDSVAHMQVIAEIEDAFDIMMETDDVIEMATFELAQKLLTKYGVTFD